MSISRLFTGAFFVHRNSIKVGLFANRRKNKSPSIGKILRNENKGIEASSICVLDVFTLFFYF